MVGGQIGESFHLIAILLVDGVGDAIGRTRSSVLKREKLDEALRIFPGERLEEDGIHQGEDRSINGDAER